MTERKTAHSTFVVERTVNASPARVFAAFSTLEGKSKWFGAVDGLETIRREFEFRERGHEHFSGKWTVPGPSGTMLGKVSTFDAVYLSIVPDERVVYAYDMTQGGKPISCSLATIEVTSQGAKTHLKITEQGAYLDGYDDAGQREHGTNFLTDLLVKSVEADVKAEA